MSVACVTSLFNARPVAESVHRTVVVAPCTLQSCLHLTSGTTDFRWCLLKSVLLLLGLPLTGSGMPRSKRAVRRPARYEEDLGRPTATDTASQELLAGPSQGKRRRSDLQAHHSATVVGLPPAQPPVDLGRQQLSVSVAGPSATTTSTSITGTISGPSGGEYGTGNTLVETSVNPIPAMPPASGQIDASLGLNLTPNPSQVANDGAFNQPELVPQVGVNLPLGLHVPMAIKEKIWEGSYIDLALLYNEPANTVLNRSDQNNLTLVMDGERLVLKKTALSRKKLDSFDLWQSAFHVFMAIYAMKHLSKIPELLKYTEIIRKASIQFGGMGWKVYDEQFRMKQATTPTRNWGNIDMELWLTVVAGSNCMSALNQATRTTAQYVKPKLRFGTCFAFNSAAGCHFVSCKFAHICGKCSRTGHGAPSCRIGGQARWFNTNHANTRAPAASQHAPNRIPAQRSNVRQATHAPTIAPSVSNPTGGSGQSHSFRTPNTN